MKPLLAAALALAAIALYVGSTPSLEKNEHVPDLYVVAAVHIFNTPSPAPRLQWSPDGSMVSVMALVGSRPQVVAIPVSRGEDDAGSRVVRALDQRPLKMLFGIRTWTPMFGRSTSCVIATFPAMLTT